MTTPKALYPTFDWFTGIVEDRDDPLEIGRVRCRINGYHTPNKATVPTEDLPWAHVVQPPTSQALDGVGQSPTGMAVGTHVVGWFADGAENCQEPIIMGSIGGLNADTGESDTPRLSRSKGILDTDTFEEVAGKEINKLDTILVDKLENAVDDIPNSFQEPLPRYAGKYPTNHVYQSESGHVIEVDDTESGERLHTYHKSGTYEEIGPLGERIVKVVGEDWEMVIADKTVYVDGNVKTIVTGNGDVTIRGDSDVTIDGASQVTINGGSDVDVLGNSDVNIVGSADLTTATDVNIVSGGNFNVTAEGNGNVTCGGTLILKGAIVQIN